MRALRFEASDHYAVHPAALWPLLSDTARLNRAIGLQSVNFTAVPREDGGSTIFGEFRQFGLTIAKWTEHAFNFVRPQHYNVVREYSSGPLLRVDGGVTLLGDGEGTLVTVFAEIVPRHIIGWVLAKYLVGPAATKRVLDQCRIFEAYIEGQRATPFPQLAPRDSADERQLDELVARLVSTGADGVIVRRLREHLRTASDERVVRMRPFELADQWETDRHATLVVFLHATTVGLLKLLWDTLCPNCRVPKSEHSTLSEVQGEAHCDVCNMVFDASFDHLVEVRFTVAPSVRDVMVAEYCVGGPQNTPHVVAQAELQPGESTLWTLPADATTLRLRSPQSATAGVVDVRIVENSLGDARAGDGAANGEPELSREAVVAVGSQGVEPSRVQVLGPLASLAVENRTGGPAVIALEERFWPDTAATAALVSTLQDFRDLFSADVLAPGLQVGIERLAILFTDIAGSTAMYEAVGQAKAFRIVQDHFKYIETAVRMNHGAIVKTIGDAVMAVFPTVPQALRAGFEMQRGMAKMETYGALKPEQFLRVGIHSGPCLAVTLNDRLDYFGTSVNVASRVEHEAGGGQIALTLSAFSESGVREVSQAECENYEQCEVELKGVSGATGIVRLSAYGP